MTDQTRSMTDIVAKYLRKYPDFLVKHPEVLQAVKLPHESGAAVSLIERQVEQAHLCQRAANDGADHADEEIADLVAYLESL